mmetsp:Transcript_15540/g.42943  ORF Transcript_15540/g.42943 Transcript_15540/m.42943 type:complete len:225 (+) Transcript_15540:427-1101(+)
MEEGLGDRVGRASLVLLGPVGGFASHQGGRVLKRVLVDVIAEDGHDLVFLLLDDLAAHVGEGLLDFVDCLVDGGSHPVERPRQEGAGPFARHLCRRVRCLRHHAHHLAKHTSTTSRDSPDQVLERVTFSDLCDRFLCVVRCAAQLDGIFAVLVHAGGRHDLDLARLLHRGLDTEDVHLLAPHEAHLVHLVRSCVARSEDPRAAAHLATRAVNAIAVLGARTRAR